MLKSHPSKPLLVAGIDEVGRGAFAGPLFAAAVILKPRQKLPGLKDSKKLTPKNREKLYQKITKNCVSFGIAQISHKFIDKYGLTKAVQQANKKAVSKLQPQPGFILIDGNDKQILTIPYKTIIKGDTFVREIMAASILAKVSRDQLMVKLAKKYPQYRFEKHKGYGTRLHRQLISGCGPCEIHRKSYILST